MAAPKNMGLKNGNNMSVNPTKMGNAPNTMVPPVMKPAHAGTPKSDKGIGVHGRD